MSRIERYAFRIVGYAYPTSVIAERLGAGVTGCWYFATQRSDGLCNQDYAGPFRGAEEAEAACAAAFPGLPMPRDWETWLSDAINRGRARRTELTETGEQYVMPGCERHVRKAGTQLSLWD